MKHLKFFSLFVIGLISTNLSSQNIMYQWRTHLAYNNASQIAMTKDKVYAVSDGALFSVNKSDKHIETHSKITGLSDNNIGFIAYSRENGELLIAYENGNIDFIDDYGSILNFPDIYRANLNAEKKVNDVLFVGNYAYLSYSFGIVKLYLKNMEVADTYFIGENGSFVDVKSLSIFGNYFYAVTPDKIYKAPTSGANLVNFANWSVISDVPTGENLKAVTYNSKLYLLKSDGKIHIFSNDLWQNDVYSDVTNIYTNDNALFLISNQTINYLRGAATTFQTITLEEPVRMAIYDSSALKIWLAAAGGYGIVLSGLTAIEQNFVPNGPATNNCRKIKYSQDRMYFVPGSRWILGEGKPGNVMIFENNTWKNIYQYEIQNATDGLLCLDLVDIEIDRNDKTHFWTASFRNGIYEFRNDRPFFLYNSTNSGVEKIGTNMTTHLVNNLFLDNNSKMWFSNAGGVQSIIKYLEPDPDGTGPLLSDVKNVFYTEANNINTPGDFIALHTNQNIKFLTALRRDNGRSAGILAFDDNGTPSDVSDDRKIFRDNFYYQDGKIFNAVNFRCLAMDKKNNTLWLGTNVGPIGLPNPQNIFNDNYTATRVTISRNDGTGLADYLLDGQSVLAIKIDGANRKWIGTEKDGVYLMSDDGTETIYHFTSENSPLLSDCVYDIGINDKTGEVFFATSKGIISFQSDSTVPPGPEFKELHAYPNPVRPEHIAKEIPITITGLAENSVVKITDTAGNLVYETISKGGMVTWDGKRRGGAYVSTGVYFAICTSKDKYGKTHHATTKILIVN